MLTRVHTRLTQGEPDLLSFSDAEPGDTFSWLEIHILITYQFP